MQREQLTYTVPDRVYGSPNMTAGSNLNYMPLNTVNVQPGTYTGSSDNYGYGFNQQKDIRSPQVFAASTSIPQFTHTGTPFKSSTAQYANQTPGGSGVRGPPFALSPSNPIYARPFQAVQPGSVVQPANLVQPPTATFLPPVKSSFVQPVTNTYAQQQTPNYIQPPLMTYNTQQNQPLQKTPPKPQYETVTNTWAEQQFERPKYPKLYNNSAQYYRNLAPEEDPTGKKTCCSSCCWILVGLIGLLVIVFGVLCGLGIVFGDSFNFSLPSNWGRQKPATVTPRGSGEEIAQVKPEQPVATVIPVEPATSISPVKSQIPDNSMNPTFMVQPTTTSMVQPTTTSMVQPTTTPQVLQPSTSPSAIVPTTSSTYGYDLGYQPMAVTSTDFNSVPLSTNAGQWNPTTVEPITATYQ